MVSYIKKQGGTKSDQLLEWTMKLFAWTESQRTHLQCQHISGKLNVLAESFKAGPNSPNRMVPTPADFKDIWRVWTKSQIDLFAMKRNNKLPTYISPVPDPAAFAIDALTMSWEGMCAYAFPAMVIISKVLEKSGVSGGTSMAETSMELHNLLTDFPLKLPIKVLSTETANIRLKYNIFTSGWNRVHET